MCKVFSLGQTTGKEAREYDEEKEEEQTMDRAEYVPHPDGEGYALFLHDSFHLLSQEDMNQPEEE